MGGKHLHPNSQAGAIRRLVTRAIGVTSHEAADLLNCTQTYAATILCEAVEAGVAVAVEIPPHARTPGTQVSRRYFAEQFDADAWLADVRAAAPGTAPKPVAAPPRHAMHMPTAPRHFNPLAGLLPSGPVLREGALDYKRHQRRGGF